MTQLGTPELQLALEVHPRRLTRLRQGSAKDAQDITGGIQMAEARTQREPKCPVRPGDDCSLCLPGASGPQDCGLVYLVMSDPELRERVHQRS